MGLDVFFAILVLIFAIRGWFRGFWKQSIRLGSFVAAVYSAAPIRDFALPIVDDYLGIRPDVLQMLLWWGTLFLSFILISSLGHGLLRSYQSRSEEDRIRKGLPKRPHRGNESAGSLLGMLKGILVASMIAGTLQSNLGDYRKQDGWLGQHVSKSKILAVTARYHFAEIVGNSVPVQHLVAQFRDEGFQLFRGVGDDASGSTVNLPVSDDRQVDPSAAPHEFGNKLEDPQDNAEESPDQRIDSLLQTLDQVLGLTDR